MRVGAVVDQQRVYVLRLEVFHVDVGQISVNLGGQLDVVGVGADDRLLGAAERRLLRATASVAATIGARRLAQIVLLAPVILTGVALLQRLLRRRFNQHNGRLLDGADRVAIGISRQRRRRWRRRRFLRAPLQTCTFG